MREHHTNAGHDGGRQPGPQRAIAVERALLSDGRERGFRFLIRGSPQPAMKVTMPQALLPVPALHGAVVCMELLRPRADARRSRAPAHEIQAGLAAGRPLRLALETVVPGDGDTLFGGMAIVAPRTGDGRGSLPATLIVHAALQVFGSDPDRTVEPSEVFVNDAGECLRGTLGAMQPPAQEVPWQLVCPH